MPDLLLWRRLTETDHNSIHGHGAHANTGGGAMHISLGTEGNTQIPITEFLESTDVKKKIETEASSTASRATLTFHGNPSRRGGEWRINDQFNNRHPALTKAAGFPDTYNQKNRPIVFVARLNRKYHVRFMNEANLQTVSPGLFKLVSGKRTNTGIVPFDPSWSKALSLPATGLLVQLDKIAAEMEVSGEDAFNPKDVTDGRRKMLAEVVRRQGQRSFRNKLLKAYGKCAICRIGFPVILEAAHITPYKGTSTNHISNGLLLRGDVHTLFDLGLITVTAGTYVIEISSDLAGTEYLTFSKKKIHLPTDTTNYPSIKALEEHNKLFRA